jgi:hypothetical protein
MARGPEGFGASVDATATERELVYASGIVLTRPCRLIPLVEAFLLDVRRISNPLLKHEDDYVSRKVQAVSMRHAGATHTFGRS